MRTCAMLAVFVFGSVLVAADDKPVVKEIPIKGLNLKMQRRGKATDVSVITSAEELKKDAVVGDAADELAKKVDFDNEKLLVFAWAGSGQDKLNVTGEKKDDKVVLKVTFTPGRTRDLRPHIKLFVVPKDADIGN